MEEPVNTGLDNFQDLPLDELKEMQDKLKKFVEKRLAHKRKEALQQIKDLVSEHELVYEEVLSAIRTVAKRGKAPALYRNPDKPRQTWSGKGEPPEWYLNAPNKAALKISDS